VNVTRLVQLLQPAGLTIEQQTIASLAMHEKWALSGMTVAGIKAAIYSMRVAARMADDHVARHGFAPFDVYVRARPDMYRLRQGGSLPRCVVSCCFNATVDGALYTAEATPGGVRERGDVGGGDNFVWARPHVWSQVLYHWDTRFAAISEATWQWNKHNPEAMVAQAAQELGFRSLGCGGLAPGMRGECAAACDETTRRDETRQNVQVHHKDAREPRAPGAPWRRSDRGEHRGRRLCSAVNTGAVSHTADIGS